MWSIEYQEAECTFAVHIRPAGLSTSSLSFGRSAQYFVASAPQVHGCEVRTPQDGEIDK